MRRSSPRRRVSALPVNLRSARAFKLRALGKEVVPTNWPTWLVRESTETHGLGFYIGCRCASRGGEMLLVSKAALPGIVLLLLTPGISGPRPAAVPSSNPSKGVLAVEDRTDVKKVQETLRDKGHYRGGVDGVIGLRTRAGIRAYQTAEDLPVTGELDAESDHKAARRMGTTLHRVSLPQGSSGIGVRGEQARHQRRWSSDRTLQSCPGPFSPAIQFGMYSQRRCTLSR